MDEPTERPDAAEWLRTSSERPALTLTGVPTSYAAGRDSEAWRAPTELRTALARFSTFDSESAEDLASLPHADRGDWLVSHLAADEVSEVVAAAAARTTAGPVHVFVGGDGIITHPICSGLRSGQLARTGMITLDAHHDVTPEGPTGPTSHGSVRRLIEEGLPGDQIVQIGVHSFGNSHDDRRWAEDRGVRVATMAMVDEHGIQRVVEEALLYLAPEVEAIYVSVDLGVLDRAYAPACAGAMPGGFTPRQLANAVRRLAASDRVVAADFVEVDPAQDVGQSTVLNLANAFLAFAAGVHSRGA